MYLFQIEWRDKGLSGYQQNTLLRAFLYNLKTREFHHLFPRVGRTDITYVSIDIDLTLEEIPPVRKLVLLKKVKEFVTHFRVVGVPKDVKYIENLYKFEGGDSRNLTKFQLLNSPFKSVWISINEGYKNKRLTLDIRKFVKLIKLRKDSVVVEIPPYVSVSEMLFYMKIKKWGVLV